jgi:hypothetical protein
MPETPSPLEISDLRLRLRKLQRTSEESLEILNEIAALGHHAAPLVQDLIGAMRRVYFPSITLVPIIAKLKSIELLEAAIGQDQFGLNTFDKCILLKAGFLQFQQELLDELFGVFECDAESRRSEIVDALADAGTVSALETLRVIEYRTAARIPELSAELSSGDVVGQVATQLMRGENLPARKEFLERVRRTIRRIGERPDPLPVIGNQGLHNEHPDASLGIHELLARPEDEQLEFKAALRWDPAKATVDEKLQRRVLQTIAGFANGKGGTLLIGIDPERKVVGLQNDFASLKGDGDSFERHLRQLLQTQLGKAVTVLVVKTSLLEIDGKAICRVDVSASSKPLFAKTGNTEEFFVRSGNATIRLEGEELAKYIQQRFIK